MASDDYLTLQTYEDRFGEAEATWLTQATANGDLDETMVQKAIDDAVADAESYLVGRYTLPFDSVPPVLVGIVADLARERLHIDSPSEEVTRRGDLAREALKDFSKGTRRLPLPTGAAAEETISTGSPVAVARDPVFSDSALAGYGSSYCG